MANVQTKPGVNWINEDTSRKIIPLDNATHDSYPNDRKAEDHVVGHILQAGELGKGNEAFKRVSHLLSTADFYWKSPGYMWRAMERVVEDGQQIDLHTVVQQLSVNQTGGKSLLELVGGEGELIRVATAPSYNLESMAQTVVKAALLRSMMAESQRQNTLANKGMALSMQELTDQIPTINRDVETRLFSITKQNAQRLDDAVNDYMATAMQQKHDPTYQPGIPTGLLNFDKLTLGLGKQKLFFISAPTGWGKTQFFITIAVNVAIRSNTPRRVLFISNEMPIPEMTERVICNLASVDTKRLESRKWDPFEEQRLLAAQKQVNAAMQNNSLMMVHLNTPTLDEIESKLVQYQYKPGYDLVIIDYLGIGKVRFPNNSKLDANAQAGIMYAAAETWKVTYDIPLMCGIQMNKDWTHRSKKRKFTVNDLYYGTGASQYANFVGFLFHPFKADSKKFSPSTPSELQVAKHRSGSSGEFLKLLLDWEPQFSRFRSEDPDAIRDQEDDDEDEESEAFEF